MGLYSGLNGEILKALTKLRHSYPKLPQKDLDLEMTLAFVKNENIFLKIQLLTFKAETLQLGSLESF